MKHFFAIICVLTSFACVGCAVHDGHEDEPAPIWWPAFMYRPTTHPTQEEYDQTDASPGLDWPGEMQPSRLHTGASVLG